MSEAWSVLVTGPTTDPEPWLAAAGEAGWRAVPFPLLTRVDGPDTIAQDTRPDWIAITSSNAIGALDALPGDWRDVPLAVVGEATAERLFQAGWQPRVVPLPGASHADGLADALLAELDAPARVLWPRGVRAAAFGERLSAAGHKVDAPAVYDVVARDPSGEAPPRTDAVFLASPSAVRAYLAFEPDFRPAAIAIGWTTFEVVLEQAERFSITLPLASPDPGAFAHCLASFVPAE